MAWSRTGIAAAVFFWILGSWGAALGLEARRGGGTPPPVFRLNPWKPLQVRPGEPRILPWVHRDFELEGRVVVPRGRTMDLVFHLERGPFPVSQKDDRTLPLGPLDWSALRLSAGDVGPPFFSSRALPRRAGGGWRVPPGMAVDVRLVLQDGWARAEVGHKPLPRPWKVHTREGILAFVGEGTWETLTLRPLDRPPLLPSWLEGALLCLLGGLALGWAWGKTPWGGPSLVWGNGLAALAAWTFLWLPAPPEKDPWTPEEAPSFQEAAALYGGPEGFRNWGAWAGSLYWRGRREVRRPGPPGEKRILLLGDAQVWGRGVTEKVVTFPMQAEGVLEGLRPPGAPPVHVLVGACRETDLARQGAIFQKDLRSFRPDLVVLVLPRGSLRDGAEAAESGLAPFFTWAQREKKPFLLLPPLAPGPLPPAWAALARAVRARGGKVWDPSPLWKKEAGCFLEEPGPWAAKGDLSRKGHLLLGPVLAKKIRKLIRF